MSPAELRRAMGTWPWFVATAGGLGHGWPGSGTWGSLPPVALFAGLAWMQAPAWLHMTVQSALGLAACRGCLRHGGTVEAVTGRKDPGVVVVDEVAGMAFTLVLAVAGILLVDSASAHAADAQPPSLWRTMPLSLSLLAAGSSFFWFRVMDVLKPPPARKLQKLPGGLGVLIDDVVVAPYAAIACVVSLELWVRYLQPVSG